MLFQVLQRVCKEIPPDIPIILDAKRSAAGDAAQAYATAFFSAYNVGVASRVYGLYI